MTAELGRARHVPIEKLEAGMKVHRDVEGRGGKVLVSAGEILTRKHVEQLRKWEKRDKPLGPAIPKKNHKDIRERVQRSEFQGGWKPSHFNPHGILVSATLASGAEVPEVEKNPEASPFFQKVAGTAKTSVAFDHPNMPEGEIAQKRILRDEIRTLEGVNAQLGGEMHVKGPELETLENHQARRDALAVDNDRLINELKSAKTRTVKNVEDETNGNSPKASSTRARPASKRR